MTREKGEGVPCQPATLSQGRKRLVDGKVWMCRYASLIWAQIWVSSDCRTPCHIIRSKANEVEDGGWLGLRND